MSDRRLAEAERAHRAEPHDDDAREAVQRERMRTGLCLWCGDRQATPCYCCDQCHATHPLDPSRAVRCKGCPVHHEVLPGRPRRASPPTSPHECPGAQPGVPHDLAAEFHYVDVGVGFVAAALLDVWCKRCREQPPFCSTCGGVYHPREGCNGCGFGGENPIGDRIRLVACNGLVAAAWCPTCGDCECPVDDDGNRHDLNDPACPLHAAVSPHAVGVSEEDDPRHG